MIMMYGIDLSDGIVCNDTLEKNILFVDDDVVMGCVIGAFVKTHLPS